MNDDIQARIDDIRSSRIEQQEQVTRRRAKSAATLERFQRVMAAAGNPGANMKVKGRGKGWLIMRPDPHHAIPAVAMLIDGSLVEVEFAERDLRDLWRGWSAREYTVKFSRPHNLSEAYEFAGAIAELLADRGLNWSEP
jgi:hypothetical protein